jgi:hypothetical protein
MYEMTFKKYTAEEIIKASECCQKDDYPNQCRDCPMDNLQCGKIMHKAVHEVMITQKAEIDRLSKEVESLNRLLDNVQR